MKIKISIVPCLCISLFALNVLSAHAWRSALYPEDWTPGYRVGDMFLHDFSYAGYMMGEQPIPETVGSGQVVDVTKSPYNADKTGANDVTATLQQALNDVGQSGGGIVYLPAGTYKVKPASGNAALSITHSNVLLKGDGIGKTFIRCFAENMRSKQVIAVGTPKNWNSPESGAICNLAQDIPNTPTTTIYLTSVGTLAVGDWVIIRSDRSSAWINEHQMSGFWAADANKGVTFYRQITAIDPTAKTIEIDIPTRYYMQTRDNARVYKVNPGVMNVGLQDFSIGNKSNPKTTGWGEEDYTKSGTGAYEVHSAFLIKFTCAVHSWAKGIATYNADNTTAATTDGKGIVHMSSNGLDMDRCRNLTIDKCDFSYPQYEGGGGNGYAINHCAQECLIINCTATSVRHGYAFKYSYASGNVIHGFSSVAPKYASDFHMYLSMSNLIDNQNMNGDMIDATVRPYGANVGDYHGLTTSQTVFWNTNGIAYQNGSHIIDSRQHGYGYIIGTRGVAYNVKTTPTVMSSNYGSPNTAPEDFTEGINNGANLEPHSLYYDQLSRRLDRDICIPVVAQANDENLPENVLDGDLNTRWSASGDGIWIDFCLGDESATVSGIKIAFFKGNQRAGKFDVLSSLDGKTWTSVATNLKSSGTSLALENFTFAQPIVAKKLRILGHGTNTDQWNSYTEVKIMREGEGDNSDTGIENGTTPADKRGISIYPNPVYQNGNLTIRLSAPTANKVMVQIADLTGKTVFSQSLLASANQLEIDNLQLASGLYVLTAGNVSERLIVK